MNTLRSRLQRLQGKANETKNELDGTADPQMPEAIAKARPKNFDEQLQEHAEHTSDHPQQERAEDTSDHPQQERAEDTSDRLQQDYAEQTSDDPQLAAAHDSLDEPLLELTELSSDTQYAQQWSNIGVQQASNEFGSFLLRSLRMKRSDAVGMHTFGEWELAAEFLNAFYPDQTAAAEQFLFLDLETTGLGSGTGNVPFMVGLAYWNNDSLIVRQALIRHPAEERAMLAYVHQLTASFTHLVTYNGKSFDWPLMHSRYVLNGMRQRIWEPLHIDLLHPSRAIWRNTLESCKLSYIEKMRLGIIRKDDLPGAEAPARYFEFLNNGDPQVLADVYRHNEIDMLSLVTLAIRFGHLLSDRDIKTIVQQPSEPEEMVRTGLWLERMNCSRYAEQLFDLAVHIPKQRAQTLLLLAARDKKVQNMERAVKLWEMVVHEDVRIVKREHVEAAIELSMYYEHKRKQPQQALNYAEQAMERLMNMAIINRRAEASKKKEQEQLKNRIVRLKKKCNSSV